jgi:hypothetical protein
MSSRQRICGIGKMYRLSSRNSTASLCSAVGRVRWRDTDLAPLDSRLRSTAGRGSQVSQLSIDPVWYSLSKIQAKTNLLLQKCKHDCISSLYTVHGSAPAYAGRRRGGPGTIPPPSPCPPLSNWKSKPPNPSLLVDIIVCLVALVSLLEGLGCSFPSVMLDMPVGIFSYGVDMGPVGGMMAFKNELASDRPDMTLSRW